MLAAPHSPRCCSVHKRPLGQSSLSVAPLAFGGNVFGWSVDEKRSFELLDAFVDAGGNLIDTADVYSAWVPGKRVAVGGVLEPLADVRFGSAGSIARRPCRIDVRRVDQVAAGIDECETKT